ncbi:MAG: T9SS type A sorting domain-containing protein [Bacteroidota bacterium]|nr:T9SS type A sorting domain-containing protein [Bacteroidota bacterium]
MRKIYFPFSYFDQKLIFSFFFILFQFTISWAQTVVSSGITCTPNPYILTANGSITLTGTFLPLGSTNTATGIWATTLNGIATFNNSTGVLTANNTGNGVVYLRWSYGTGIPAILPVYIFNNDTSPCTQAGEIDRTVNPADIPYGTGANDVIFTIAPQSNGKVLIGGGFSVYNGITRNCIARLNEDGSLDGTFNPGLGASGSVPSVVYVVVMQSDGKILIGGNFTNYNGRPRKCIARLNADGSLDSTFKVGSGTNDVVYTLALQSDGKVLMGGKFTTYNGTTCNRIVRLMGDGTLDTLFKSGNGANGDVHAIVLQPDGKVYIGGNFTIYFNSNRNRIARLNTDGSLDTLFKSSNGTNGKIRAIAIQQDGKVLIGGDFNNYNSSDRNHIARLNTDGSLDATFIPGTAANNLILTLSLQTDGKVLIGGVFTSYNGSDMNRIARLKSNGSLDSIFNPGIGADNYVDALAIQADGKILIGGSFSNYNSIARNRVTRINTNGSLDAFFNPNTGANNYVFTLDIQPDEKILIGGYFTSVSGTSRNRIARLNKNGSNDTTFNPGKGIQYGSIWAVKHQLDGKILIGGNFTIYNGVLRNYIARLEHDGSIDSSFNLGLGPNSIIYDIAIQPDGKIIVGGAFSSYNGINCSAIARLNSDGTLDNTFIKGIIVNGRINSIAIQNDGKILIGGPFYTYQGILSKQIARLNLDGSLDISFNPGTGADWTVESLALQSDGKVLIGGWFESYNGIPKNRLVRLNSNGSLDSTFNLGTGPDRAVKAIAVQQDGKILIGGEFDNYNSITCNHITRLNKDGTFDISFKSGTGTNNYVNDIALQSNGKAWLAGDFTSYNQTGVNYVSCILGSGSGTITKVQPDMASINDTISIIGNNLSNVSSVLFPGNINAQYFIQSDYLITTTIPLGATTGLLTLSGSCGTFTCSNFFKIGLPQTINGFSTIIGQTFSSAPYTISGVSASSGLTVTFSGNNLAVASVLANGVISILGVGNITITANQVGNITYLAATPVSQVLTVSPSSQTITGFSSISNKPFGNAAFTILGVIATSGLTITFSGSNPNVAKIFANGLVSLSGVGTVTITATQFGNSNYLAATPVSQVLTVIPGPQTITGFDSNFARNYGSTPFSILGVSATSGLPITFSGNNPSVALVSNNGVVSIMGAGNVTITAYQLGNANYLPAIPISQVLTITKASQTITGFTIPPNATLLGSVLSVSGSSSSGLPLVFVSSNPSVVSIVGNQLFTLNSGQATIYAYSPGNINYLPSNTLSGLIIIPSISTTSIVFTNNETVTLSGTNNILIWPTLTGSVSYCIRVSSSTDFTTAKTICGLSSPEFTVNLLNPVGRSEGQTVQTYYYQVCAVDATGIKSKWSEIRTFVVVTETANPTNYSNAIKEATFKIYPNPNNGTFTIATEKTNASYSITTTDGKKVEQGILKKGANLFENKLPKGVYLITVGDKTVKLVVE